MHTLYLHVVPLSYTNPILAFQHTLLLFASRTERITGTYVG